VGHSHEPNVVKVIFSVHSSTSIYFLLICGVRNLNFTLHLHLLRSIGSLFCSV